MRRTEQCLQRVRDRRFAWEEFCPGHKEECACPATLTRKAMTVAKALGVARRLIVTLDRDHCVSVSGRPAVVHTEDVVITILYRGAVGRDRNGRRSRRGGARAVTGLGVWGPRQSFPTAS
jgi:hypothetical protein